MKFKKALKKVILRAVQLGFSVKKSTDLDKFFKGDLDGKSIWLNVNLSSEDSLFNTLHLLGHNIQWSVSQSLRELGNQLWENPSDEIIKQLQDYEWEANCYALTILHQCKITDLDQWLQSKYTEDIVYLTHYYKTGEKSKEYDVLYAKYLCDVKPLVSIVIPKFKVEKSIVTRNGIVI